MTAIASRDLRKHTAEVPRHVRNGNRVTVIVNGEPIAHLEPVAPARRPPIPKAELVELLRRYQADAGLRGDLAALTADTTGQVAG